MIWKTKRKYLDISGADTFSRVQKVKHNGKDKITLRGNKFCFKK